MKVQLIFAWYDFWIGVFYDSKKRWIYFFPVPTLGIIFKLPPKKQFYCYADNQAHAQAYGGDRCDEQCKADDL